jgi:hypothetical protein
MWDSFRNWYIYNQDAISWFIIGWLSFACLNNLATGNYFWAGIDFVLAYFNYKMTKVRM